MQPLLAQGSDGRAREEGRLEEDFFNYARRSGSAKSGRVNDYIHNKIRPAIGNSGGKVLAALCQGWKRHHSGNGGEKRSRTQCMHETEERLGFDRHSA